MKKQRTAAILLIWLVMAGGIQATDQQATFTPADPFYGDYVGVLEMDRRLISARAMVVAEKHKDRPFQYRVRIIESGGDRKTIIELRGKQVGNRVLLAREQDGSWTGVIEDGLLRVARKGDRPARLRARYTRRTSPTEGMPPPEGAVVLLPYQPGERTHLDQWQNQGWTLLDDGSVEVSQGGNISRCEFGAVRMHVEFAVPYKCYDFGQGRGNSGVYLLGRYEVQVLDTYGYNTNPGNCGGIYANKPASVEHVCFPPTAWQTYDILFYPARFGPEGKRIRPAQISVLHNGVSIHAKVDIANAPTPAAIAADEVAVGPLHLQDHGNPVRFRNIWYEPVEDTRD